MKQVCPICGVKQAIRSKKRVETIKAIGLMHWGYDPVEGDTVYWPCERHTDIFNKIMDELAELARRAGDEYREIVRKRIADLKAAVTELAPRVFNDLSKQLRDGEGLVFWVCNGGRKFRDSEVMDLAVAVVRSGGELKYVYGNLRWIKSYRAGEPYSLTHYISQDLEIVLHSMKDVRWRGFIQGLYLDGANLEKIVHNVFMATHENPTGSLVDILSTRSFGMWYRDIEEVIRSAQRVDYRFFDLVDTRRVEKEVAEEVERRYGVPPYKVRPKNVLDYVKKKIGAADDLSLSQRAT